jgi:hypothetical protein
MKKSLLKAVIASIVISTTAWTVQAVAEEITPAHVERFADKCDVDQNGMISKAKVMKHVGNMLGEFEKKSSGQQVGADDEKSRAFLHELQKTDGGFNDYALSTAELSTPNNAKTAGMLSEKKSMAFLLELQRSDGGTNDYLTSKADIMKKIETAFDKHDDTKAGMLNMKQAEAFLRELTKSGS